VAREPGAETGLIGLSLGVEPVVAHADLDHQGNLQFGHSFHVLLDERHDARHLGRRRLENQLIVNLE
jgi:hypothetical protein